MDRIEAGKWVDAVVETASRLMREITEELATKERVGLAAVHMVNTEPWELDDDTLRVWQP